VSEPIIRVQDATFRYAGADGDALSPISLSVEAETSVGIVGESGSGKSTLARLIVGLEAPTTGEVLIEGMPWKRIRRKDRRRREIQMIFQDPYGALNPGLAVVDTVAEVYEATAGCRRTEARRSAAGLLEELGLDSAQIQRRPGRLSGGQCQRVGIARALAASPRVLVADEPTSALDVSVQAQILEQLDALRATREFALVFISHDLAVIRRMTHEVIVMQGGRVVERGETAQVFDAPTDAYTRTLIESIPGQHQREDARE
jgi:peptide/nickel transport system ATP-binding protein